MISPLYFSTMAAMASGALSAMISFTFSASFSLMDFWALSSTSMDSHLFWLIKSILSPMTLSTTV